MSFPTMQEQKKILKIISEKNNILIKLEKTKEDAVRDIQEIVDNLFQKK